MRVRFQADADLDGRIIRGLRRTAPEVDLLTAAAGGILGLSDPEVLREATRSGRILVSQDRGTMPGHFAAHLVHSSSPGVILLRSRIQIVTAIEELILVWSATEPHEWKDRLVWIPL
jgi:hypothetical protein